MLTGEHLIIDSPMDLAAATRALEALFSKPAVGIAGTVSGSEVKFRSLPDEWGAYYPFRIRAELSQREGGSRLIVPFSPRVWHVVGLPALAMFGAAGLVAGGAVRWWSVLIMGLLFAWVLYDFRDHYVGERKRIMLQLRTVLLGAGRPQASSL